MITHDEVLSVVAVVAIIAALALYLVGITVRKRQLLGRSGGIPLAYKGDGGNWALGVGRYHGDELWWYGALRLGNRPTRILRRSQLEVTGQRRRRSSEPMLRAGDDIVECVVDGERVALSLPRGAVTGFLSWLESSAPHS